MSLITWLKDVLDNLIWVIWKEPNNHDFGHKVSTLSLMLAKIEIRVQWRLKLKSK